MAEPAIHRVSVYYEDTDHSGLVYHANYLKYCERAREHLLGRQRLVAMYRGEGTNFVVYKAEMSFKEGARFGDELEVRTTVELASEYRLLFHQDIWREGGAQPLVKCVIHLVAVSREGALERLPDDVIALSNEGA